MLPHTGFTIFHLGSFPIQIWGLFVASGFLVGVLTAYHYSKRRRLDFNKILDFGFWIIIIGLIGARLGHIFLYDWLFYRENLVEILFVWRGGLSSIGGFIGAGILIIFWARKNRKSFWKYADVLAFSFPLAWGIGRIGCFLIHDHPGICTNFFLGMQELSGCARHDLGFYEAILGIVIFMVFIVLDKRFHKIPTGLYSGLLLVLYSVPRFFLDFLRMWEGPLSETRYLSLTPAQYGAIVLLFVGGWLLYRVQGGRSEVAGINR